MCKRVVVDQRPARQTRAGLVIARFWPKLNVAKSPFCDIRIEGVENPLSVVHLMPMQIGQHRRCLKSRRRLRGLQRF
ncbi:MAG: hypothetical protein K0R39_2990 [Symbiobacteriaceae bacterium]|nr:hypothetical protein [Symbiobacteriaceae bacterium]